MGGWLDRRRREKMNKRILACRSKWVNSFNIFWHFPLDLGILMSDPMSRVKTCSSKRKKKPLNKMVHRKLTPSSLEVRSKHQRKVNTDKRHRRKKKLISIFKKVVKGNRKGKPYVWIHIGIKSHIYFFLQQERKHIKENKMWGQML